jgi:hypothetical protein
MPTLNREDTHMALGVKRARQIARRVPAPEWDVLELASEVPWLEGWLKTAPVEQVAVWARTALANVAEEPIPSLAEG